jgi:hypothetical protein
VRRRSLVLAAALVTWSVSPCVVCCLASRASAQRADGRRPEDPHSHSGPKSVARADPSTFSLEWKAPSGCPGSDFVVQEIARLLGRAPGRPSDPRLSVRADVAWTDRGVFRVRVALATSEASGERTFEDAVCARVATATALVASLAIDPESGVRAAAPAAPTPPRADALPQIPMARPSSAARRSFSLGGETGLDLGIFPAPAWRFAAVLGLSWRSLRYELVGGYDPEQHVPAPMRPGQGARIQLGTLALRGCLAPLDHVLEIDTCIATEGGWFVATGEGISSPITKAYPWAVAYGALRLVLHAPAPIDWKVQAEGGVALVQPIFDITGSRPGFVHQPSRFVGQVAIGAHVRFQ